MNEKTLASRVVFQGRLLRLDVLDIETAHGARATREIVRHPGAAAALAQLPDGRYVFVKQYRKPVERVMLEIVAGLLHPGEAPDAGMIRELREESGYGVAELVSLGTMLPSPGYVDERLHLYFARLQPGQGAFDRDADEHLDVVYLTLDELRSRIRDGGIADGKTLAAWALYSERFLC